MFPRRHILITGTGRAGTTFLVELLTRLGLDTGFSADSVEQEKNELGRAGLERDIREKNCPFIVKDPLFCNYVEEVVYRDDIVVEHIFIPIRDLNAAAESRRHVARTGWSTLPFSERLKHVIKPRQFFGGLWETQSSKSGKQEDVLLRQIYKLLLAISDAEIPVTLIRYPRLTKDSHYLFGKLKPVLQDMDFESFAETFDSVVRPELVHSFNEKDC